LQQRVPRRTLARFFVQYVVATPPFPHENHVLIFVLCTVLVPRIITAQVPRARFFVPCASSSTEFPELPARGPTIARGPPARGRPRVGLAPCVQEKHCSNACHISCAVLHRARHNLPHVSKSRVPRTQQTFSAWRTGPSSAGREESHVQDDECAGRPPRTATAQEPARFFVQCIMATPSPHENHMHGSFAACMLRFARFLCRASSQHNFRVQDFEPHSVAACRRAPA
jgi:hypothetical protein